MKANFCAACIHSAYSCKEQNLEIERELKYYIYIHIYKEEGKEIIIKKLSIKYKYARCNQFCMYVLVVAAAVYIYIFIVMQIPNYGDDD